MLTKITSADNSRVKLVRKLATRKGRLEERAFTAEGRNLVGEILDRRIKPRFILVSDECAGEDMLEEATASEDIMVCEVPEKEFRKLTDAGHGVGMLAVVDTPDAAFDVLRALEADENVLRNAGVDSGEVYGDVAAVEGAVIELGIDGVDVVIALPLNDDRGDGDGVV